MNTVMDAVSDGLTVSMVEVDAAAARAALTDRLQLADVDLEHPAAAAVLAAVVAAGWRPPTPGTPGGRRIFSDLEQDSPSEPLFGDSAGVGGGDRGGPPGRR